MRYFYFLFLLSFSLCASGLKVQFPSEELASESVLPVFPIKRMVMSPKVSLAKRVELGGSLSAGLDEPFYLSFYATGLVAFYFSEFHGVSLTGTYFFPKRSQTASRLAGGIENKFFDVFKAPYPQMMGFLNYQFTPFYGKISLSKSLTMNLSIYSFLGPGLLILNTGNQLPVANIGIGQKLYFNKWFAIRGDIGFYGYYGPAVAKIVLDKDVQQVSYEQIKEDQKRPIVNFIVNIGVVFLI